MSDFLETIWNQFGIEAEEHLELIEQLLIETEKSKLDSDGIAQMFRSFHSLKGLAKALDLLSISTVAHKAEDILGLARDGSLLIDSSCSLLLFEAFDKLKKMLSDAVDSRKDCALPETLILKLEAFFQAANTSTMTENQDIDSVKQEQFTETNAAKISDEKQNVDPEMLQFYANLVQENLPDLEFLISTTSATVEIEQIKKAFGSIEKIHHATQVIGLQAIAQSLENVYAALTQRYVDVDKRANDEEKKLLNKTLEGKFIEFLKTLSKTQEQHQIEFGALFIKLTDHYHNLEKVISNASNQIKSDPPNKIERRNRQSREQRADLVRVEGKTLDQFMNRIGEMVSVRGALNYAIHDDHCRGSIQHLYNLTQDIRDQGNRGLTAENLNPEMVVNVIDLIREQIDRISQADILLQNTLLKLQESVLELRVVPIDSVLKRLPRVVRDLAQEQQKEVQLEMNGQDVRIDKSMIDVLIDPLIHMVRNSIDHGIECASEREKKGKSAQALIKITATQRGNHIELEVSDDGKGLNSETILQKAFKNGLLNQEEAAQYDEDEILQLIFLPGFSTTETITETSGRGVGLDVVKTNVTRMGGRVRVHSELNKGTQFMLHLPFSVAIQDTLLVNTGNQVLAIPDRYVTEIIEISPNEMHVVKGQNVIELRGDFLPIIPLNELLGISFGDCKAVENSLEEDQTIKIILLSNRRHRIGLKVDGLQGRRELFVKEIHPKLAALPGVGGASTLGDGSAVLILDGEDLFELASSYSEKEENRQVT